MLLLVLLCSPIYFIASVFAAPSNSSASTSTYAKVAKWGAGEARSSGQSLYTQSSQADIRSGQNLPYNFGTSRIGSGKSDSSIPGTGEVTIQERFNPRPYFDYGVSDSKPQQDPKPSIIYSSPADSFQPNDMKPSSFDAPVSGYIPPKEIDAKPSDPYNSPITSYNPAPSGLPTKTEMSRPSTPDTSYLPSYDDKVKGYDYSPPSDDNGDKFAGPYAPADDSQIKPDSDDDYSDHHHNHHHHHDEIDLNPPTPDIPDTLPKYLDHGHSDHYSYDVPYSFDDHHHVYHEIKPTTTTTEAPEDERVNKGHYSYYYLGRKLWYIPLYFSVYFIIYITVLILKSIARHKVNFAHDWKGKGRSFEGDDLVQSTADVHNKINTFKRRYIAM